jgi:aminopeptidase N
VPQHYRLDLAIVPERETFGGSIEIDVKLSRPATVIWLNGTGLEIADATIRTSTGKEQRESRVGPEIDFIGEERRAFRDRFEAGNSSPDVGIHETELHQACRTAP